MVVGDFLGSKDFDDCVDWVEAPKVGLPYPKSSIDAARQACFGNRCFIEQSKPISIDESRVSILCQFASESCQPTEAVRAKFDIEHPWVRDRKRDCSRRSRSAQT